MKVAIFNMYTEILKYNQLKILNLFNLDDLSVKKGLGDRKFWAWKTIDFANATFQSAVNSLAVSIKLNIALDKSLYLKVIDKAIKSIPNLTNSNNSLNEAFPNENSYCVSALVSFDVLFCIDLLKNELDEKLIDEYLTIVKPLIDYLLNNKEVHAVISNHLATAAASIFLWEKITDNHNKKFKYVLNLIYKNQSDEGWYLEYEGPDHGYQTLCVHYLSIIYYYTKDPILKLSLEKSFNYLYHFIHPDGTIGGLYGSRNTELIYPGGLSILRNISEYAFCCWVHLDNGIKKNMSLFPQDVDSDNYVPLLNSFALAALNEKKGKEYNLISPNYLLKQKLDFKECGIQLFSNKNYFSILNYKKGGTLKVYDLKEKKCVYDSGGLIYYKSNEVLTSQSYDKSIEIDDNGTFYTYLYKYNERFPLLYHTILIRIMSMTIFNIHFFRELFKRVVVKSLITRKSKTNIRVGVNVTYNSNSLIVRYNFKERINNKKLVFNKKFKTIHMASSGYLNKSNIDKSNLKFIKVLIT